MNYHAFNHKSGKLLLPLIILALTAGGCHQKPSVSQGEIVSSQETIAESVLETEFTAAASVQTEFTDVISESLTEPESVLSTSTETVPTESVSVTSSESSSVSAPETTSATTAPQTETVPEETSTETEVTAVSTSSSVSLYSSTETMTETSVELTELKWTYQDILNSILQNQCFQEDVFTISDKSTLEQSEFAVFDVDLDGMDELVIRWAGTNTDCITGVIYGYDSQGNICRELLTTPYMRFYSNGVIEADVSTNPALSKDFPAYILYQYDAESNSYQEITLVEPWEKSYSESNPNTGELFPDHIDVNQSGVVYYDHPFNHHEVNKDYFSPKSRYEYLDWHSTYVDSLLDLPFKAFDKINENS